MREAERFEPFYYTPEDYEVLPLIERFYMSQDEFERQWPDAITDHDTLQLEWMRRVLASILETDDLIEETPGHLDLASLNRKKHEQCAALGRYIFSLTRSYVAKVQNA